MKRKKTPLQFSLQKKCALSDFFGIKGKLANGVACGKHLVGKALGGGESVAHQLDDALFVIAHYCLEESVSERVRSAPLVAENFEGLARVRRRGKVEQNMRDASCCEDY